MMSRYFTLILIILILFNKNVENAKILGVFPLSLSSHFILGSNLMTGLAEKGHEVVMITKFHVENVPKNISFKEIYIGDESKIGDRKTALSNRAKHFKQPNLLQLMLSLEKNFEDETISILKNPKIKNFLETREKFDAVIVEQFNVEALKIFSWYCDAHLIVYSTIGANNWLNHIVGNPSPPSYIPDIRMSSSGDMTFFERLQSFHSKLFFEWYNHFLLIPSHAKIVKELFPNAPPLETIIYNTSLVLLNSHISTNQAVPKVPNMIDIGGVHVKPPKKLPKDLQEILDGAKNGVIYFSLGTNIRSADLPESKREIFLNVFSKLKEKVLWKWENDDLPGKPSNVIIRKWFPQQDILAHPNVKLFITHAGLLSTMETIYHGIPVLNIPVYGDQYANAEQSVLGGYGHRLGFYNLTESYFEECLHNLLDDPKYTENAKRLSKIFHDRPLKPIDTAAFWVGYVVRHNGAKHLRVEGLKLSWYQYLLLDVVAVCFAVILISFMVMFYFINKILYIFRCQRKIKKN